MRLCRALLLSNNILLKASYCLLSTFYLLQTTIYQLPTFLTVKCSPINKRNSVLLTKLVSKYEDVYFSKEYSVDFSINHTINYTGGNSTLLCFPQYHKDLTAQKNSNWHLLVKTSAPRTSDRSFLFIHSPGGF